VTPSESYHNFVYRTEIFKAIQNFRTIAAAGILAQQIQSIYTTINSYSSLLEILYLYVCSIIIFHFTVLSSLNLVSYIFCVDGVLDSIENSMNKRD
jgi:hypothetical protein